MPAMMAQKTPRPHRRWWLYALSLLAGLAAAPFGYDIGQRIAGPLLGWVMGLNSALFCTLIAGALLDRLARIMGRGRNDAA